MENQPIIDKHVFLKCFLKDFYIEKINKKILEKIKGKTIHDNIIFRVNYNFDVIKNVIATLLIKEFRNNVNYNYYSMGLYKLVELSFNNHNEETQNELEKIKKCSTLIVYEFNDMDHSLYKSLYYPLVAERLMKGKNNIFLLCNKQPTDILDKSMLDEYFEEISLKSISTRKSSIDQIF